MTRSWGLSLLLLTIPVALVTSADPAKNIVKILRPFKSIEFSDANMRQCLWFAMQEYNKESEDKYIFLVSQIQLAQMQITDHMEYIIEVEIARSNCRKPLSNNENCVIQKNFNLEKRMNCSFLVVALPWNGEFSVLKKECWDIQV
ncbi:Cystatin-8 [Heterocephalus glaber]|uniref:Cystatin-8 n=1 Tax=Heterocephalus glaber TaxID=10181 RepID=G5CBD5_HETGA|nr:cystatin-8 [Heterocephalus glaber]EHB18846.1 Cystatin-8 [Heterocephalus glaber]